MYQCIDVEISDELADEIEKRAANIIEEVDRLGGAVAAIESGFYQREIGNSAYDYQLNVERGDQVVCGFAHLRCAVPVIAGLDGQG